MTDASFEPRVLVVNPDGEAGGRLGEALAGHGFRVNRASSGAECLALLAEGDHEAVVSERTLGDLSAGQLMERCRSGVAFIVLAANGSVQEAVRLAKLGLDDYLPATVPVAVLAARLREILAEKRARSGWEEEPGDGVGSMLIGHSRSIREVVEISRLIAPKRSTVLITGPTGTGKELVARLIHSLSPRANLPMVTINCGAIPESLLEAEFFGHVKGAFTGAIGARLGRFEQAHGSTLFLDEIGEMSFELQAKVLRAIQEREFQRVGSSQTVRVDISVLAATNCDLAAKVRRGEFREDLYYRLNVVPIVMPPLAEHIEDLPLLVEHCLEKLRRQEGLRRKRASAPALERLMQYHWPGNVRQLENALEKAVVLSGDRGELLPEDFLLPSSGDPPASAWGAEPEVRLPAGGLDLEAFLGRLERGLLEQALERAAGNKKRAADMLRLKRTTLSAKLQVAGIRYGWPRG